MKQKQTDYYVYPTWCLRDCTLQVRERDLYNMTSVAEPNTRVVI